MKIIECPRDAWQGHHPFIPTEKKAEYINQLLRVGFDTLDFGSFVSPKAMPQVSDTASLLDQLDRSDSDTKLLAIVANERGAEQACSFEAIDYLGYPFSISETFQLRNTNTSIEGSLERTKWIAERCSKTGKQLVIYISMGFGNPYGDLWNPDIVLYWIDKLSSLGIRTFSLSDTVGVAKSTDIESLFSALIPQYPDLEFGAHFHTTPDSWRDKTAAAYQSGCRRFDGAILGYGGCPMAQDDLVGNMPTERLIEFSSEQNEYASLNISAFHTARNIFQELMGLL
ncbi:hydroxymethylglutaryl-CoA lyase [Dyadobacter luteus]|uniref:Hydroxymethylglutaryl-CoA lyase n=1 Tax=Dyadobacter luteus TaxID=2259619 RepID=A0A3D8YD32_9BACT|nr:hydroxymethylglutaryl-CoA lyase [Dyadobacter luteus]REA62366.1 hydroxymethylglutaryl-CoA lyase [Dyadobacter luteus]